MNEISEKEIIDKWLHKDRIYISCICNTYNHKKYIEKAIDSILTQNIDRQFEILIHDDLSTDGTRDILRKYKKLYPSIIRLVLQDKNQYSQGKRILPIILPQAKGDYIALCEGDDFWCNKDKLSLQYEAILKSNSDIVFSSAHRVSEDGKKLGSLCQHSEGERKFSIGDVICGGGGFMPTASIFFSKSVLYTFPTWFGELPVGDYYLQILASKRNGAYFIPNVTCCYRVNAAGSWSVERKKKRSEEEIRIEYLSRVNALDRFNSYIKCGISDFEYKKDNYRFEALSLSLRIASSSATDEFGVGYISLSRNVSLLRKVIVLLSNLKFIRPILRMLLLYKPF